MLQLSEDELSRAKALRARFAVLAGAEPSIMSEVQRRRLRKVRRVHACLQPDVPSDEDQESSMPTGKPLYDLERVAEATNDDIAVMTKRVNDMNARREAIAETAARQNEDLDIRREVAQRPTNSSLTSMAVAGKRDPGALQQWQPPVDLVGSSSGRVAFIPDKVMYPAEDNDDLEDFLQQQRRICKGCLNPIKKKSFAFRGPKYDARFCYYTGYYYCFTCHTNAHRCRIPARCLVDWDFNEYPVCDKAGEYLEMINDQPLFCISAHQPQLYMRCPLLSICRQLRLQLGMMHEVGNECARFRSAFYTPPTASMQTSLHEQREAPAAAYLPPDKVYLVNDSECWSLSDLAVFHASVTSLPELDPRSENAAWANASPARSRRGVKLTDRESACAMLQYLRRLRSQMVRHIAHGCPNQCHQLAAKACGACTIDEVIYSFDLDNTVTCPRCHTAFHRHCWETKVSSGCPNCASKAAKAAHHREHF